MATTKSYFEHAVGCLDKDFGTKYSKEQIFHCLKCFNGDKNKALDMLLNGQVDSVTPEEAEALYNFDSNDEVFGVRDAKNDNLNEGGVVNQDGKDARNRLTPLKSQDQNIIQNLG